MYKIAGQHSLSYPPSFLSCYLERLVRSLVYLPVDLSRDTSHNSCVSDDLEPAIWFKVMVLHTINVDCSNRVVTWADGVRDRGENCFSKDYFFFFKRV